MQEELGSAGVLRNQDFISINSKSYIQQIYNLEKWFEIDIDDETLGKEILLACEKTHCYTMKYETEKMMSLTNYEEWVKATKEKYSYKTDRVMFKKMKYCRFERFQDRFIIVPWVHAKLKLWERSDADKDSNIILGIHSTPAEIGNAVKQVLENIGTL